MNGFEAISSYCRWRRESHPDGNTQSSSSGSVETDRRRVNDDLLIVGMSALASREDMQTAFAEVFIVFWFRFVKRYSSVS